MTSYCEGYTRVCPVCGESPCNLAVAHEVYKKPEFEEIVIEGIDLGINASTDADLAEQDLFATRRDQARPKRPSRY